MLIVTKNEPKEDVIQKLAKQLFKIKNQQQPSSGQTVRNIFPSLFSNFLKFLMQAFLVINRRKFTKR